MSRSLCRVAWDLYREGRWSREKYVRAIGLMPDPWPEDAQCPGLLKDREEGVHLWQQIHLERNTGQAASDQRGPVAANHAASATPLREDPPVRPTILDDEEVPI